MVPECCSGTELLSGNAFEAIAAGGNEGWDATGSIDPSSFTK